MHSSTTLKFLSLIISALAIVQTTISSDPDILSDFIVPPNVATVDANFFTFTAFRNLIGTPSSDFKILLGDKVTFPALDGQSLSCFAVQQPAGSTIPPHIHPRSPELIIALKGTLQVGFIDATNKLYTQTLQPGDLFIVPKGLVHYTHNAANETAQALAVFSSAYPGVVLIPNNIFNTTGGTIDDDILAFSFRTDVATIQTLKKNLAKGYN